MILLPYSRPWTQQPQGLAGLNAGNPLVDGLAYAWAASAVGPAPFGAGLSATPVGLTYTPSSEGVVGAFDSAGTTYLNLSQPSSFQTAGNITLLFRIRTTTDTAQALLHIGDGTANNRVAVYIGDGVTGGLTNELITFVRVAAGNITNGGGYTTTTRSEITDGAWHTVMVCGDSSSLLIYLDGVSKTVSQVFAWPINALASVTGATTATVGVSSTPTIGGKFNGNVSLFAFWRRNMAAYAAELHRVPWGLFEPQRIWVPVSAGGSTPSAPGVDQITLTTARPYWTATV